MRKNRKLNLLLVAINLMAAPTAIFANNPQQVQVAATTVKLNLNHNTRVYNKKG
ncbi:hypothetical protein PT285_03275 [Lactobacillus sp. ESL0791]|uniref:hypothetical protein n=1 Tax=Lactobacillus sp. ESL0791 TaxID=2983234 RepID=UPI0023F6D5FC|nr:hypothetical protein [Lactobacillus sp. ESL0791]MDF7638456.1 hypothetical protein [Lactobacillus sp. ESL0791]